MHRIDVPSATVDNMFTEGSPAGGVPATTVSGNWLNAVQEEVCEVIEQAGLVLDKNDNGQLWAALNAAFAAGVQATETVFGILKVATQELTDAGTDDVTAVTPKKLRKGFAISLNPSGYIAFPSWLGGFIIQWVNGGSIASIPSAGNQSVDLVWPLAFPVGPLVPWVTVTGTTATEVGMVATSSGMTASGIKTNVYNPTATAKSVQSIIAFVFGR